MRAAVLAAPGLARLEEVPLPEPTAGMVRVRLEGCGVCGSNLPPWEGRAWFNYPFSPGAPGHEGWGRVDAIGPDVTTVRVDDRVAVLAYHSYAEYDLAPETNLVRLPDTLVNQPFPGEALGCAMNVLHRSQIKAGERVAVVGVGFLGAVLAQLAARRGAKVIAISRRPLALEIARACGALETVVLQDPSQIVGRIKDFTDGAGCDCVIEAVGLQGPLDLATDLTRERGRLVIAGYHQDGPRQVNMQLWNWRGLDVINAHERDAHVYVAGIQAAVQAMEAGELNPASLFTHRFGLGDIGRAFECMRTRPRDFMKALVIV